MVFALVKGRGVVIVTAMAVAMGSANKCQELVFEVGERVMTEPTAQLTRLRTSGSGGHKDRT